MAQTFSNKLDALLATIVLFRDFDSDELSDGLAKGAQRHTLSIGSGGSAITAEYLARCRDTLGLGPTTVQTPMQAVVEHHQLSGSDVWLFSAGGDNPDVVAAAQSTLDRGATTLHLVTRNRLGGAVGIVKRGGGIVHIVPVADMKDGYLATHSLLSSATALLLAADSVSRDPQGRGPLLDAIALRVANMRNPAIRASRFDLMKDLGQRDTMIIAADPQLRPLAMLLDTSIWEASLCSVQTTDFRNLAHGRHTWLHHRAEDTHILALTGVDSRPAWAAIDRALPKKPRRLTIEYGACGRLENLLALVDGLGLIEAMGTVLGVDPGKPGIAEFGRKIYEDRSLADLADAMPTRMRHKRAAVARSDAYDLADDPLQVIGSGRLETLAGAVIGAAVFDYDGTIVNTADRYSAPNSAIIDELVRLHRAGLRIGIATGRGGSVSEDLRKALPSDVPASILIGYYNGGYLRTADVNIDDDPADPDPAVAEAAAWLSDSPGLFLDHKFKHRSLQITVDMDKLNRPYRFAVDLANCPPFSDGRVRVTGSGHSYDIVPSASSKLSVVDALKTQLPPGVQVLCFGDSGSRSGNDYALLSHPLGISVGDVCGSPSGCWSIFGFSPVGPAALVKVLRAIAPSDAGGLRLDIAALGLDSRRETSA